MDIDEITDLLIAEYIPRKVNPKKNAQANEDAIDLDSIPNTWEILCLMLPMLAVIIGIGVGLQIAKTEDEILNAKRSHFGMEEQESDEEEETANTESLLQQQTGLKHRSTKAMIQEEFEFEAEQSE